MTSSESSSPPLKRTRTDEDTREIVYHKDDIWPEDGNIVLAAREDPSSTEATIHTRLFKCHKSILSIHSVFFNDLFKYALPSPAEQHEDTPLMTLWDSAKDVKNLMTLFYDAADSTISKRNRQETYDIRLSVLRLATKYQMDGIRSRIVGLLEADWPKNLHNWASNEEIIRFQWGDADVPKNWYDDCGADPILPEPASIVRLAYELDVPSLLPAAFYHATRCYRGDPEAGEEGYGMYPDPLERFAATKLLTPEELGRLIITKDWLHKTTYILAQHTIPDKIDTIRCVRHSRDDTSPRTKCIEPLKAWWTQQTHKHLCNGRLFDDPLTAFKNISQHLQSVEGVCYSCRSRVDTMIDKARSFLWLGIPSLCQLEVGAQCPRLSKF